MPAAGSASSALAEALNSTGRVTSWNKTTKLKNTMPVMIMARDMSIRPITKRNHERFEPQVASGTMALRRLSGA
ncbi:MAG: hypothetical protein BWY87_01655 [Deltaproteobacteria bacterium ADurb.Bin510]|nr:MAG: hypothetical protein BWY87_01655 [Deltaproteobacteria bacterium ADurb.Bin510]